MPARTSVLPPLAGRLVGVDLTGWPRRGAGEPSCEAMLAGTGTGTGTGPSSEPADGPWFGPGVAALPDEWRLAGEPTGRAGELTTIPTAAGVRWLAGVGERRAVDWRTAGATLVRAVTENEIGTLNLGLPADVTAEEVGALVLGLLLGDYRFQVTTHRERRALRTIRLRVDTPTEELRTAVRRAAVLAAATVLARDLANTPSNVKNPVWLASTAARVVTGRSGSATSPATGLAPTVRDEQWLARQGFGGILAVGGGSATPPRLLELAWRPPGSARRPHLVLVGKGVTFDTGGVSLKPATGMHLMRTDMAGGAAVIAALRAVAELGLPVRVTGLVPMAENHLSGSSYRPGDVVRHYGGTTTQVSNTDAEGRLLLADALAYAVHRHDPDLLVDVATLTGAMKTSLGVRTGGLFATDDELAERIRRAGETAGEAWWRMPLLADHADAVRGDLADLRQMSANNDPGAIFAALFLREFTGGLPWAHLDIAGPARADKAYAEVAPGATGFAARTLACLAESLV